MGTANDIAKVAVPSSCWGCDSAFASWRRRAQRDIVHPMHMSASPSAINGIWSLPVLAIRPPLLPSAPLVPWAPEAPAPAAPRAPPEPPLTVAPTLPVAPAV